MPYTIVKQLDAVDPDMCRERPFKVIDLIEEAQDLINNLEKELKKATITITTLSTKLNLARDEYL